MRSPRPVRSLDLTPIRSAFLATLLGASASLAQDSTATPEAQTPPAWSAPTTPMPTVPAPSTPTIQPPPPPASIKAPPVQDLKAAPSTPQVSLSSAVAAFPSDATAESLLVFVELRSPEVVQRELDDALTQKASIEIEKQTQKSLQARSEAYRKLKNVELESLKTRIELAGKEKKDVEKKELERQKKIGEAQLEILQKLSDLRSKEMETTDAKLDLAEARRKALEKEAQLITRRIDREKIAGRERDTSLLKTILEADRKIRKLEGEVLDTQIEVAKRQSQLAEHQTEIIKARKKIFESESKLLKERAE